MNEQKVFLKGEIITLEDLIGIRNGYIYLYEETKNDEAKHQYLCAVGTVEQIIKYLKRGKTPLREI